MATSTRNKRPPNRFDEEAAAIVADATKGGRKPKKSTPKPSTKKPSLLIGGEPDVIEQSPPPTVPFQPINPPMEPPAYSISTSVLWKGKEVRARSTTSKRFDFHEFNSIAIQEVEQKAEKKGYRVILKSAIATLSSSGNIKAMNSQCGDIAEWEDTDNLARQWLVEEKRKGVTVRIVHTYGPKEDSSESESSTAEEPPSKKQKKTSGTTDDDSSSDDSAATSDGSKSSESNKKKKQKKKTKTPRPGSATAKQILHAKKAKKLERKLGSEGHKIMKLWLCSKPGCRGRTHYCWQPDGPDGTHYLLDGDQITKWNKAIAKQERGVDAENPPIRMQERMKSRWDRAMKAKAIDKEIKSAKKEVHTVVDPPVPTPAATPAPISISLSGLGASPSPAQGFQQQQYNAYQQQYNPYQQQQVQGYSPYQPMLQQPQYFPSQQYAHTQTQPIQPHLPSPIKLPSRPGTADRSPSKAPQLPSSPVRVEGDAGELRRAYFAWQIQRNPSEEAAFADALEKIEVESYTLKQIRRMSPSDWKEIEVSRGMAIRLKDEVKDFVEVLRLRAATSAAGFASRRPHTALDALAAAALLENEVIDEDSDEEGEEGEEEA